MAHRFTLPFHSLPVAGVTGEEWAVELWDSEFAGAVTEPTGDPKGCVIKWVGDQDTIKGVMGSNATYSILIEEEADMTLITALAGATKGRFKMVIRRSGDSTVYWAGTVHTDEVSYPDAYFPFLLEIFATDGIADLKDIKYVQSEDTPYEGSATIMEHLVNIVGKIGMTDVGTWPTNRFRSTANWYSDDMVTTEGPMTQADVMHDRFWGKDVEGNGDYWSSYAVLDAFMSAMNCQFFHEGGMYHIRQIEEYHDATQKEHYYDATGTLTSTVAAANLDRTVDYATAAGMKKLAGGLYTFLPSLKEVCVDYHHLTNHNRATGQYWDRLATDWAVLPGVVLVDAADTTYLKGKVDIRHRSQIGINPPGAVIWPPHRYRFLVQVRIPNGAGTYYYLKRESTSSTPFYDLQPDEMDWDLAATTDIKVWGEVVNESDNLVEKHFSFAFTTPFLYTDFDGQNIEMRIRLDGVEKTDGTTLTVPGGNYVGRIDDWNTLGVFLGVEEEGVGSNPDNETWRTCAEATGGNTEKRYLDTYLGDGPAPFSLSTYRVGGVATTTWQMAGVGVPRTMAALLAQQVLRFRKFPQPVYQGAFLHKDIRPFDRFVDDDKGWMATSISVDCFNNVWSGEFLLYDSDVDGITIGEPYIPPPGPLPPTAPGPGYPQGPPTVPDIKEGFVNFPPFNGFVGGTVPGHVAQDEISPVTLLSDLLASDYNTTRTLPVGPIPFSWARKGDRLVVINGTTGHRETFTVGTSYEPNDTEIIMSGSDSPMVKDFPYGSFVKLLNKDELRVKGWSYLERGVTGEEWTIPSPNTTDPETSGPGGLLPSTTVYDVATLRERVMVWRTGLWLVYSTTSYDNGFAFVSGNKIKFWLPLSSEDVMVVVR
jgi:hypothetical protein